MKRNLWVLGAGLLAGLVATAIVRQRLDPTRQMPYRDAWRRTLGRRYGEAESGYLAGRMQQIYGDLYARRPCHRQPVLRYHLTCYILPALALYQALREKHGDARRALDETEELLEESIGSLYRRSLPLLRYLPDPFPVWRRLVRLSMALLFPPAGWAKRTVADDDSCYAFDVTDCVYLRTLCAYGAAELTPAFCRLDDVMAEWLPPSIVGQRTGTLGLGDDRCDFRWYRA